jgi:hypothetical protein
LFVGDRAEHANHRMTPLIVVEVHPFVNCDNEFRLRRENMTGIVLVFERRRIPNLRCSSDVAADRGDDENTRGQPPAELSQQKVSELTGAVQFAICLRRAQSAVQALVVAGYTLRRPTD